MLIFVLGNQKKLVPTGMQNVAESPVNFVEDGIVMQSMGPNGLKWAPLLTALFFFISFCNIFAIIPGVQMPATATQHLPIFPAEFTWFGFTIAAIIKHRPTAHHK